MFFFFQFLFSSLLSNLFAWFYKVCKLYPSIEVISFRRTLYPVQCYSKCTFFLGHKKLPKRNKRNVFNVIFCHSVIDSFSHSFISHMAKLSETCTIFASCVDVHINYWMANLLKTHNNVKLFKSINDITMLDLISQTISISRNFIVI